MKRFPGDVPLPPNWGGFMFCGRSGLNSGRAVCSRLHDRFRYARQPDDSWKLKRLAA